MDSQILPINTSSSTENQDKSDYNNKSILLTTTNKKQLVFLKPNNNANNKMYCVLRPEDLQLRLPSPVKVPKPGRPKRTHNEDEPLNSPENKVEIEEIPRKVFRTRSGRVTKPPRYINEETNNKPEHQIIEAPIIQNVNNSVTEIKDNKVPNIKRNISAQYRCETCKKAYLGRAKMLKHLQLNADHVAPKFFTHDKKRPDLWTDLINKTKNVPKDEQVRFIYDEFVSFIQKAREVLPKLLKSENDTKNNCISVDSQFSNALGIPEGFYSVIEQNVADVLNNITSKNTQQNEEKAFVQEITNSDVQIQNTDQNSLLNLLDTGQVSFDNSNSEEVMNVDQLIHERLKSLTGGEIETNSASQNLHLDLSLDMFPYHTNNL